MNIFILDENPVQSAKYLCDKHVVKMILESAQMLSSAHRILDGTHYKASSKSGKRLVSKWSHANDILYEAVHINHPCTKWTMETSANYTWHYTYFECMASEYMFRYNKEHSSYSKLKDVLCNVPKNIKPGTITPFALAMPIECKRNDPVESYRIYYKTKLDKFKMNWKDREIPFFMS